ncbi:capsule biosynthesis protein [Jannaschia seohaensis]|uniref:Capsular polysaccharide transport system permease protein n=1 Tax=Jannaschia seohaensis TaxID=475081 RepID=A0A2Y9B2F6_9RHOB|nr:capsule biosynthesis protein [Jannaschia seohaensis]PWJ12912.1 capsular polysaccharide transport system permease protein [Jannaschia seohaensis]SSA50720.1 capsular polysaccharide transport system permease protein [Jannaschia seohaensis]
MTDLAPDRAQPLAPSAPAYLRGRHIGTMLSFVALVLLPTALAAWYMYARAADRYVSTVNFSVYTEQTATAIDISTLLGAGGSSSSSDTDILYSFIQSQELVRQIEEDLDLRTIWTRVSPQDDPIFAYHPPGTIEDLTDYWNRMVRVYNDGTTGLLELQVQAFTPEDATAIAQAVYDRSSDMINALSAIAEEDGTRNARADLDEAVEALKQAREAITRFRNETQIVDPAASIQSQMGILSALQAQQAEALIELDLLAQSAGETDPRVVQARQRLAVIENRIEEELEKFGGGATPSTTGQGERFADLVGQYESLIVDLEFAQETYTNALAAFNGAVAEARRQSRYLAAHVRPTLAERSTEPKRLQIVALTALFTFLAWGILVLAAYALRDRR